MCADCLAVSLPPPPQKNIQTGKLLAGSKTDSTVKALDGYLARLDRLGRDDKNVPSRLRFLVREKGDGGRGDGVNLGRGGGGGCSQPKWGTRWRSGGGEG
jgi:hypothetical protein